MLLCLMTLTFVSLVFPLKGLLTVWYLKALTDISKKFLRRRQVWSLHSVDRTLSLANEAQRGDRKLITKRGTQATKPWDYG